LTILISKRVNMKKAKIKLDPAEIEAAKVRLAEMKKGRRITSQLTRDLKFLLNVNRLTGEVITVPGWFRIGRYITLLGE